MTGVGDVTSVVQSSEAEASTREAEVKDKQKDIDKASSEAKKPFDATIKELQPAIESGADDCPQWLVDWQQGEQLRVSVRDQGSGIPDSFKSRIFSKFSQADASDSRRKGGTGLGLAIVHQLVAAGDGTAELRASRSGGIDAVVTFRTPADR